MVCRELGYFNGTAQHPRYWYRYVPIWLRQIQCSGNETSLLQCSHDGFGNVGNCSYAENAGVECNGIKGTHYNNIHNHVSYTAHN